MAQTPPKKCQVVEFITERQIFNISSCETEKMENDDRNSLEKSHESIDSLEERQSMDWVQVPVQVVLRERPLHERQTMSLGSDDVFCDTPEGFDQRKTFRPMKAESEREISEITHDTSIDEPGGAIIYRKQNPTSFRRESFASNEHKIIENPVLVKEVTETVELQTRSLGDDKNLENNVKAIENSYDDTEVTVVKDVRAKMYDDNIGHRVDLETLYIVERANASQPILSNDITSKNFEECKYKKTSSQTRPQGPADRLKMNNLYLMNKKIVEAQRYDENLYEVHSHGGIHCIVMYVNEKQNFKIQHTENKKTMSKERIHINVIATAENLDYSIPHVSEGSSDSGEPVSVRYVTRFETIKQERRRLGDMPLPLKTEIRRQINHPTVKLNILVVPHEEREITKQLYKSTTGKTELVSSFAQTDTDEHSQEAPHATSRIEILTSYRVFEKYRYLLDKYTDDTYNEDEADTISIWTDDKFQVAKLSNILLTDKSKEKKSEKDSVCTSEVYRRTSEIEKEKTLRMQINEGVQVKPKMRDEQVVTKQMGDTPVTEVKHQIKHFSNNLVLQTGHTSKSRWNDKFQELPMRVTDTSHISANGNDTLSTKTDYASDADFINDIAPPFYMDNSNKRDNDTRNYYTDKSMYTYSNNTGSSELHYENYSLSENQTQKEKMKNIPVKVVNVQVNKASNKTLERITNVTDNRKSFYQAALTGIKQKPLIAKNKDELIHCTLENLRKSIRQHPNDSYRVQSDYMKRSNSWSGGLNQDRHVRAKLIPIWNNDKTRDFFARVDDYFNERVAHSLKRSYSSNYLIEGPRTRVRWVRIPGETIKIEEEKSYELRNRATAEYRELPYEMRYWNILHLLNKERVMGKQLGRNFPCPLEDWVMSDKGGIKQTAQEILSPHYPVRTPSDSVLRWFLTYDQNAALTTQKYIRALEEKGQPVNFITILPNNDNYKRVVKTIRYEKLPDRMVPIKEVYQGAHEVRDHHKMEEQYLYQPVINQNIIQHQTEQIKPRPRISSPLDRTRFRMNHFNEYTAMNKAREQQQVTDRSHMEMHSHNARMQRQFLQRRDC